MEVDSESSSGRGQCKYRPRLKEVLSVIKNQRSQTFVTASSKTKFPDTVTKTVLGVVALKEVLFTLLHNELDLFQFVGTM
jgi:hypothetical protein